MNARQYACPGRAGYYTPELRAGARGPSRRLHCLCQSGCRHSGTGGSRCKTRRQSF